MSRNWTISAEKPATHLIISTMKQIPWLSSKLSGLQKTVILGISSYS